MESHKEQSGNQIATVGLRFGSMRLMMSWGRRSIGWMGCILIGCDNSRVVCDVVPSVAE